MSSIPLTIHTPEMVFKAEVYQWLSGRGCLLPQSPLLELFHCYLSGGLSE